MTNRNFVLPVYRRFGSYEEVSSVNRFPVSGSSIEVVKNWAEIVSPAEGGLYLPENSSGVFDVVQFSVLNLDVYNNNPTAMVVTLDAMGRYVLDASRGIITAGSMIFSQSANLSANSFRRFVVSIGYEYDCVQFNLQFASGTRLYYRIVGVL